MARYELIEGTSKKFWQIALDGTSFTTTFGRIGTDGQTSTKDWDDEDKAKKEHDKLIAEKTKKGYKLVGGGGKAAKAAPPPAASKKKAAVFDDEGDDEDEAPKKKAPAKAAAKAPAAKAAPAKNGGGGKAGKARYFEFSEGSSNKFWEIRLEGSSFTTRFGKIGTDGQSSTKSWGSPDQAKKEHDKLVAEKTKKGYEES